MNKIVGTADPNRKRPNLNEQLRIGSGPLHNGAWHRAIAVSNHLFESGRWDGQGILVVYEPYEVYYQLDFYKKEPVQGKDWKVV